MRATMTILIACLLLAGGPALAAATAADAAAADTTKAAADTSGHGKDKGVGPVEHVELGSLNKQLAERGKNLFDNHCIVCHALDKKKVGPPLGQVFDQRTPEFIMNMILNAPQMEQKDPVVKQLKAQYMVAMPELGLQRPQARAILEYLREQAGGQAEDPPRRDPDGDRSRQQDRQR